MYLSLAVLSGIKYGEVRRLGGALVVHKNETSTGIAVGSSGIVVEVEKEESPKKREKVGHSVDVGEFFKLFSIINIVGFFLAFVGAILTAFTL